MQSEDATTPRQQVRVRTGLKEIYAGMSAARRRQFYVLIALMLGGAVAELATIGAVVPFIALLADPAGLNEIPWAVHGLEAVGADSARERLLAATALFALAAIASAMIRLELARSTQDFTHRLGHDLSVEIQRRVLLQPYSYHIHTNTSAGLSAVHKVEVLIFNLLLPLAQAATSGFIAAVIIAGLIYIDPFAAAIAAVGFSLVYLLVSAATRRRLAANSAAMESAWDERLKIVQESLGGIRDVIIDDSHAMYLRTFERVSARLSDARSNTAFISSAPRFLIESIGMVLIAALALTMTEREGGLAEALPILAALALGAQRLLPLLQQVYTGWSTAAGHSSVLRQILDLLRLPLGRDRESADDLSPLPLTQRISVDQVSFAYPTRLLRPVERITLEIPCGSSVALVGETGSGKSTLADLLMGLLEPAEGQICVDGVPLTQENVRRWQRSIAHVPQSIFLADSSIARNIALSRCETEIDVDRVADAARTAQLHEFVSSLPEGYETIVGERGVRLSGGQRQRLGIARAIYKQAPVLVLDEATSGLDSDTEAAVLDALDKLRDQGRTLVIISHRQSAIACCDIVARLRAGRLVEVVSGAELAAAEPSTPSRTIGRKRGNS